MATWEKLADTLESWRRIPQEFDIQVNKIIDLLHLTKTDEDKYAMIWLISRNLRTRPADMVFLLKLYFKSYDLPGWMVEHAFAANSDKAEALAQILPTPSDQASIAQVTEAYTNIKKTTDSSMREALILQTWQHTEEKGRWLFHRMITGSYQSPIPLEVITGALAECYGHQAVDWIQKLDQMEPPPQSWEIWLSQQQWKQVTPLKAITHFADIRLSQLQGVKGPIQCCLVPKDLLRGQLIHSGRAGSLFSAELSPVTDFNPLPDWGPETQHWDVFYRPNPLSSADVIGLWILPPFLSQEVPGQYIQNFMGEWQDFPHLPTLQWLQSGEYDLDDLASIDTRQWRVLLKSDDSENIRELRREKHEAIASLMYIRRNNFDGRIWDEITLGMKHREFSQLVPVARWMPPHDWPLLEEWRIGIKGLLGEKFGPVTTILPGWQVQIAFDEIIRSKKHKSGFFIPQIEILEAKGICDEDLTDDILDLYHYWQQTV